MLILASATILLGLGGCAGRNYDGEESYFKGGYDTWQYDKPSSDSGYLFPGHFNYPGYPHYPPVIDQQPDSPDQ
jgi:hypothetical protein